MLVFKFHFGKLALMLWQVCYIEHSACSFSTTRVVCCFSSEHRQKSLFLVIRCNFFIVVIACVECYLYLTVYAAFVHLIKPGSTK